MKKAPGFEIGETVKLQNINNYWNGQLAEIHAIDGDTYFAKSKWYSDLELKINEMKKLTKLEKALK